MRLFWQKTLFFSVFSLCWAQHGHAFEIPRQAHQGPFALDVLQPTGQELTTSHHGFDDPKDRLDGLLAQRIGGPPGTVLSRCAMRSTGVASGGTAAGSLKRADQWG